jgi:hypothetical protein
LRESVDVVKPWYLDPIIIAVFAVIIVVTTLFIHMSMSVTDIQDKAFAEIDQMGCGELKDFILHEKWDDYDARWTSIELHAKHVYTWTCEK